MTRQFKVVVERYPDGYVAYPLGLKGVVVGQGDTYRAALDYVSSAFRFHFETLPLLGVLFSSPNNGPTANKHITNTKTLPVTLMDCLLPEFPPAASRVLPSASCPYRIKPAPKDQGMCSDASPGLPA